MMQFGIPPEVSGPIIQYAVMSSRVTFALVLAQYLAINEAHRLAHESQLARERAAKCRFHYGVLH